jgi:hypothetical protein
MALTLLESRMEGSFATAFLQAFMRADLTNKAILGKSFDIFAEKFHWEEKLKVIKRGGR